MRESILNIIIIIILLIIINNIRDLEFSSRCEHISTRGTLGTLSVYRVITLHCPSFVKMFTAVKHFRGQLFRPGDIDMWGSTLLVIPTKNLKNASCLVKK